MNIQIDYISDYGDIEKERIVLKVMSDTDLGKYLLATTNELQDSRISSKIQSVFWLPDQALKTGDRVVIYSKSGLKSNRKNDDGTITYFFYWGLPTSLTTIKDCGVVLFETTWTFKRVIPMHQDTETPIQNPSEK